MQLAALPGALLAAETHLSRRRATLRTCMCIRADARHDRERAHIYARGTVIKIINFRDTER